MGLLLRTVCFSDSTFPVLPSTLLAALVLGCSAPRRQVDAEESISRSLGAANAVVFQEQGGALDAGGSNVGLLTLADAIRRAVGTNPELQAALARVRVAEADADQARLLPNPVLSFVLRLPEGGGRPEIEAGLGADLLAILERPRRAGAADQRLEAEAARALSAALDVVADVQGRYASLQSCEELLPVFDRRLELLDRLRAVAQARLELGEGTRGDASAIDARRTELQVEAAQMRQEATLARLGLAHAIGEPSGAAAWTLEGWSAPRALPSAEQAWIEAALACRPELLALGWELRAREQDQRLASNQAFDGASLGLELQRDERWSAGPGLASALPIFDTGRARARRARALTSEERHRLTHAQRSVIEEVRSSLASLSAAQENHARVVADLLPLEQRRRAEIEEAFRQGLVDVTALVLAEQSCLNAEALRIRLARDVSLAHNRLQRAAGGPASFRSNVEATLERSQP